MATGMPDKKVQVIYNACNTGFKPLVADACILNKYTPDTDFLFFLGNTDPKKTWRMYCWPMASTFNVRPKNAPFW